MMTISRGKTAAFAWHILVLAAAGCLGFCPTAGAAILGPEVILVDTAGKPVAENTSALRPVTVSVAPYTDSRRNAKSRKLGDIKATVMDMYGTELMLGQDVSDAVTAVMKNHFVAGGFQVADYGAANNPAFHVTGTIVDFGLKVADRDEIAIVIETTVHEGRDGQIIWSGVVTEKTDRYPGVMGDSKKSITRYLNDSLAAVANKTAGEVVGAVKHVHPELIADAKPVAVAQHGVSVLIAPPVREAAAPAAPKAQAPAIGRLAASTIPARAKVHVGDVYYGLSPLKLELEPGVHAIRFTLEGFKPATEKVSVRSGETTELEMTLEK
jgi:hypothetical protein